MENEMMNNMDAMTENLTDAMPEVDNLVPSVDTGTTIKGVKKVIISITDKMTGKTFGTTWLPETAKEIGETILQYAEEGMANG